MDGWNTSFPWEGPFSGAMLVSGMVPTMETHLQHLYPDLIVFFASRVLLNVHVLTLAQTFFPSVPVRECAMGYHLVSFEFLLEL